MVRLGHVHVLRTAVPEAAVDEDRDPSTCEHDIRTNSNPGSVKAEVLAEPQAALVQLRPQGHLNLRSRSPISPPDLARCLGRRLRIRDRKSTRLNSSH